MTVTVYSPGPYCQACKMTKRHLEKRGILYEERHSDEIHHAAQAQGITAAPVVQVMPGAEMWGGYRPDRIDALIS